MPSQRWGIGRLKLPGWRVYFKGGWGSGSGAVDHQVALLTHGDTRLSVAVLTAANGSHATGKATLEGVFRRLLRGVAARRGRPGGRPRSSFLGLVGRFDRRRVQRAGVVDLLGLVALLAAADADRGRRLDRA